MQRVVQQYTVDFYVPAHARRRQLIENRSAGAKALAAWKSRVQGSWHEVRVLSVDAIASTVVQAGNPIDVRAHVQLGALTPDEAAVELYLGRLDARSELTDATVFPMAAGGRNPDGSYTFEALGVPCRHSGRHGYTVRVLPFRAGEPRMLLPGLIRWADSQALVLTA